MWPMLASLLVLANVGDLEAHRTALTGHCYRMLGSSADADDAVQDTMIRAWRSLDRFDGRSSVRTWLYRIATNVCLDALSDRKRRTRPMEEGPVNTPNDELIERPRAHWLDRFPTRVSYRLTATPLRLQFSGKVSASRLSLHSSIYRRSSAEQCCLIDVLGWSAAEVAESLDTSLAGVNSALQRARYIATRDVTEPAPVSDSHEDLLEKYVDAFNRYDVEQLTSLLTRTPRYPCRRTHYGCRGRESLKTLLEEARVAEGRASCLSPPAAHLHLRKCAFNARAATYRGR